MGKMEEIGSTKVFFPVIESAGLIIQRSLLGFKTDLELTEFKQEISIMKLFGRLCFEGMMN